MTTERERIAALETVLRQFAQKAALVDLAYPDNERRPDTFMVSVPLGELREALQVLEAKWTF